MGIDLCFAELSLRPLAADDCDMTLKWRNRPEIRASMVSSHLIVPEEHAQWLSRVISEADFSYHIFEHRGRPLGAVGFYAISRPHRRAEWTFYIGEADAPRGSGAAMLFLAADYFFQTFGLDKLCGDIISGNLRSIQAHERLGFTLEGRRRRHVLRNGHAYDLLLYALFSDNWRGSRQARFHALFGRT